VNCDGYNQKFVFNKQNRKRCKPNAFCVKQNEEYEKQNRVRSKRNRQNFKIGFDGDHLRRKKIEVS